MKYLAFPILFFSFYANASSHWVKVIIRKQDRKLNSQKIVNYKSITKMILVDENNKFHSIKIPGMQRWICQIVYNHKDSTKIIDLNCMPTVLEGIEPLGVDLVALCGKNNMISTMMLSEEDIFSGKWAVVPTKDDLLNGLTKKKSMTEKNEKWTDGTPKKPDTKKWVGFTISVQCDVPSPT